MFGPAILVNAIIEPDVRLLEAYFPRQIWDRRYKPFFVWLKKASVLETFFISTFLTIVDKAGVLMIHCLG
jgi:hypothetical protein